MTMELWNKVCETNPNHTKKVGFGKRKFTAIDAQIQIKKATELWGPYGFMWGIKRCNFQIIPGVQLIKKDQQGNEIEKHRTEIALDAVFYYPESDKIVEFEISADMVYLAGDDARKKLMTDVTTKALSKLGFNSDVFEGKFDDNKYVQEMNKKHNKTKTCAETGCTKPVFDKKPHKEFAEAETDPDPASRSQSNAICKILEGLKGWNPKQAEAFHQWYRDNQNLTGNEAAQVIIKELNRGGAEAEILIIYEEFINERSS